MIKTHKHPTLFIATSIATLIAVFTCGNIYAQSGYESAGITFSSDEFKSANTRLPYRQAAISTGTPPSALVIYLHGGTSRGNDNVSQLGEPGVDSIACFLSERGKSTIFIVPQCPAGDTWVGRQTEVLNSLIGNIKRDFPSIADVYIFGGSMGGTGTWTMLSLYPEMFSAAMPVAGNPSRCNVENVSKTPLLTVMGTDDRIMNINTVKDFLSELDNIGAQYQFDIEKDWSHEDVCIQSYTIERLDWVFSHSKQSTENGIEDITPNQRTLQKSEYITPSGQIVYAPSSGLYIMRRIYSDNSVEVSKVYIR